LKDPHSKAVEQIGKLDPEIKEAVKMFDVIFSDKRTQELLRLKEKGERDFNSVMKYSRMEGEKKRNYEVAKKLLLMGMNFQDIQEITELSISEIEALNIK
jgi:hypothetical protein